MELDHLVGGCTCPGYSVLRLDKEEKIKMAKKATSFVWDNCCQPMFMSVRV